MVETRTHGSDSSPASLKRFVYSNHIGTAALELNGNGNILSYEEYHPYGTTAYQATSSSISAIAKRYRYANKERDEETGLYYMGARYYAPWLTRWCAVDPIYSEYYNHIHGSPGRTQEMQFTELTCSAYEYCYANPVRFTDPTGEQAPHGEGQPVQDVLKPSTQIKLKDDTLYSPDNVPVIPKPQNTLVQDKFGQVHEVQEKTAEADLSFYNRPYYDQVGENIAGGFFGALGYHLGGEKGSFALAPLDNAMQAAEALHNFKRISPSRPKFEPTNSTGVVNGQETVYRAMAPESGKQFLETGKMPPSATRETMVSPTISHIKEVGYTGTIFEINLKPGTLAKLESIGVRNIAKNHPYEHLPIAKSGWMAKNAFFKVEDKGNMPWILPHVNIGLGRGGNALDIFNSNLTSYKKIGL